eukprot:gene29443-11431_t
MVMEDVLRQTRACSPHPTRPNTLFNADRVNAAAEWAAPSSQLRVRAVVAAQGTLVQLADVS